MQTRTQGAVHVFPGQGDFSVGALVRGLRGEEALRRAAREVYPQVDQVAAERGLPLLAPWLLGPAPPGGRELAEAAPGMQQLALFGAVLTVHQALVARHGEPRAVLGVSFGEVATATAAGVFSPVDGARIAHDLALVLIRCPGGLSLLGCGEDAALALIDKAGADDLVVACVNDNEETVVSGPTAALAAVEVRAEEAGTRAARLRLPFASHHPALRSQAEEFARAVRGYPARPPRCPVFSAVAGRAYTADDDLARRLADCLIRPARLPGVLRQVAARRPAGLFEAGTGSALSRSIRRVLGNGAPPVHAPLAEAGFPW